jgi:hypothetical protein
MSVANVVCNACGAAFNIDGAVGNCPFCGTTSQPSRVHSESKANNTDVFSNFMLLTPTISEADFEAAFNENVIAKDPEIIVNDDAVFFDEPFIRFQGTFTGTFTCRAGQERVNYIPRSNNNSSWNERRVDIEYVPFQAPIRGSFTVDVCVEDVASEIGGVDFMQASTRTQNLDPVKLDDLIEKFRIDVDQIKRSFNLGFERYDDGSLGPARLYPLIEEDVLDAALDAAPSPSKDFAVTFDYVVTKQTPFLAFFFIRAYTQRDEECGYIMDAGDGTYDGEAEEPGLLELSGRAVSHLVGSMKKWFS